MKIQTHGAHPPGPRWLDLLALNSKVQDDFLAAFTSLHQSYGDLVYIPGPRPTYIVFSPDYIQQILTTRSSRYGKNAAELGRFLGSGLICSEGAVSLAQRRQAAGTISGRALEEILPAIHVAIDELFEHWKTKISVPEIDIYSDLGFFVHKITHSLLFTPSELERSEFNQLSQDFDEFSDFAASRTASLLKMPYWLPTRQNMRMRRILARLDTSVQDLLRDHARGRVEQNRLLTALAKHTVSAREVRDHVINLRWASLETTTNGCAWALAALAEHGEVASALRKEILSIATPRVKNWSELRGCPRLMSFLSEVLRLFPAVPALTRRCIQSDTLGPYSIPQEAVILISPFVTHRSEHYWSRPLEFLPGRFVKGATDGPSHKFAYLPFSGGVHRCPGENLALLIMAALVARVASEFALGSFAGSALSPKGNISLRPIGGVPAKVVLHSDTLPATPGRYQLQVARLPQFSSRK